MVCLLLWVHLGLFMVGYCFWLFRLAVGLQGNPICTDDFSV